MARCRSRMRDASVAGALWFPDEGLIRFLWWRTARPAVVRIHVLKFRPDTEGRWGDILFFHNIFLDRTHGPTT